MRFEPKTEAEVAAAGLFPKGTYDFEVIEATEKTSKAGNDMVELSIKIYDAEGRSRRVFDWLVGTEGSAYKVRHFAEATGMLAAYERGEIQAEDMIGKTGQCEVIIKKGGDYPDKNAVTDYVGANVGTTPARAIAAAQEQRKAAFEDDEIPF